MSVIAMESFGHLPDGDITTTELESNVFSGVTGGLHITDLTGGRKYIKSRGAPALGNAPMLLGGGYTTIYIGFRLHATSAPGTWGEGLFLVKDGASVLGFITRDSTNHINYRLGSSVLSGVVATSTGTTTTGADDYWVVKVTFDNAAGVVEFYKNGVLDSSTTGVDTIAAGTQADSVSLFGSGGSLGVSGLTGLSDIWVDDATNHGEASVFYRPVDGVGSSADWTPTGAASNWECTDEIPPDEDTTYNASTTSGDLDQLAQTGMDGAVGSVLAVQAHIRVRKETAAAATLKVGLFHGVTHSQSAAMALSTSYEQRTAIFEDVPGGAGWTPAQLDAAQISYENTT